MASANAQALQRVKITAAEFRAKANSKAEIFRILATDVGAFLPSYEHVTIYHLKDILKGKVKCKLTIII